MNKRKTGVDFIIDVKGFRTFITELMHEKEHIYDTASDKEIGTYMGELEKMLEKSEIRKVESSEDLHSFLMHQTNGKYDGTVKFEYAIWDEDIYIRKLK